MADVSARVGGRLERHTLADLEPDHLNPRLPQRVQEESLTPDEIYQYMDQTYDVIAIAESIARHGYFESEPLIAIPAAAAYPDEKRRGAAAKRLVVVEGNRRLTALAGLAHPQLRETLSPRWARLPETVELPPDIPVLVMSSREQVAPILGFRHITGIAPWEPYPQAKYIADLIDKQKRSFPEVALLLNRGESEVRSFYRNYWVARQAQQELKIADPERITDGFGVFTRAMQNPDVRDFIDAPSPSAVDPAYYPISDDKKDELAQLVTWLFGEPRKGKKEEATRPRPGQVVTDSRQITAFGRVIANTKGRRALRRKGATLRSAQEAMRDPTDSLLRALRAARDAAERAKANQPAAVKTALERLNKALESAIATVEQNAASRQDS